MWTSSPISVKFKNQTTSILSTIIIELFDFDLTEFEFRGTWSETARFSIKFKFSLNLNASMDFY